MTEGSQKFIARNRAPRVQIEYDVELYGSEKKVQLPFVMGVMSDLAGKSNVAQPAIDDRQFLEIDVDNFDDRMKAMQPRVAFTVPNTLTGDGNLTVDLTFEKMDDFTPQAIAAKVKPLQQLLSARTQLSDLMTYMDGKAGAEALIERILSDNTILNALSDASPGQDDSAAVLDNLRAQVSDDEPEDDTTSGVLDALRSQPHASQDAPDRTEDILSGLAQAGPDPAAPDTGNADVLDALRADAPQDSPDNDNSIDAALNSLSSAEPEPVTGPDMDVALSSLPQAETENAGDDGVDDVLAGLAEATPPEAENPNPHGPALGSLMSDDALPDTPAKDSTADVLAGLAAATPAETETPDTVDAVLSSMPEADVSQETQTGADAVLSELAEQDYADPVRDQGTEQTTVLSDLASAQIEVADAQDLTDDILADIADPAIENTDSSDSVDDILGALEQTEDVAEHDDTAGSVLSDLASIQTGATETPDIADDVLADLVDVPDDKADDEDTVDDILGGLEQATEPLESEDTAEALLSGLTDISTDSTEEQDTTGGILAGLDDVSADDTDDDGAVDDILDGLGQLDDLLVPASDVALGSEPAQDDDLTPAEPSEPEPETPAADDLDDLLGDLDDLSEPGSAADLPSADDASALSALETPAAVDDLDDLLADFDAPDADTPLPDASETGLSEPAAAEAPDDLAGLDDLDDLLGDLDPETDAETPVDTSDPAPEDVAPDMELDDLLDDLDTPAAAEEGKDQGEPDITFGTIHADRPAPEQLNRKRFRLAILGDFSGRAARGVIETGDALASRKAILLDPDTAEEVIAGFSTTLVLPLGKDGAGVKVPLTELDDLHPDELYENVALFAELVGLRARLGSGATAESAARDLRAWGEAHGTPITPPRTTSSGSTLPAGLKLTDFQKLIGDTTPQQIAESPIDDLMAQIVGPHIRAVPDADTVAMQDAVDNALSAAMRMVLHHPEFQSVEAQWRSIDLIARSIETDDTLDVMLYDVSAEEIAADLASASDLSQSGFARLLTDAPLDEETGRGGYSALMGLYTFEETPPHADLLGRIARVAAHVDAPFIAAMSPAFLETPRDDRHPLVATAWDNLRAMPEAGHLGLASPRFLLRRPYGAKSEPIYEFPFEEFTMTEGLSGMLWSNPVVLVAILLAKSYRENGVGMGLGSVMSLGGMPFHVVNDRYGDQVALPCTERNLTLEKVETVMTRGLMPVVSIKGRDEIRLASFQSLAGGTLLGPWSDVPPPPPSPPKPAPAADPEDDLGLDDLLAGFDDTPVSDTDATGDDIDADLAALLEDL